MNNKITRTVDINIGGKNRKMRFNINAIAELEAKTPQRNVFKLVSDGFSINTIVTATWIGLKYEDKNLDLKLVRNWVNAYIQKEGFIKLTALVTGAIGLSGLINKDLKLFEDMIAEANSDENKYQEEFDEVDDEKN